MNEVLKENRRVYIEQIKKVILPYWLSRGVDEEYGGFFTNFKPDGRELISTNKFAWPQGRMTWTFARLACTKANIFSDEERARFLALAKHGARFILEHCITADYTCHLVMDRQGKALDAGIGLGSTGNTFADCFASFGLSACAEAASDREMMETAYQLYLSVAKRVREGKFIVAPYLIPGGFEHHAIYMVMVSLTSELYQSLTFFGDPRACEVDAAGKAYCEHILTHFAQPEGIVLEQVRVDGRPSDNLLGRHFNAGHVIESMWFVAASCSRRNEVENKRKAFDLLWNTYSMAKDEECGGIFYFLDKEGGKPAGPHIFPEDAKAASNFEKEWAVKLWWAHTETLYGLLLGYMENKDPKWFKEYKAIHDYVINTYPNPDREVGEWIQLRDRYGSLLESFGGGVPQKSPYHAVRNLLMSIELLDEQISKS